MLNDQSLPVPVVLQRSLSKSKIIAAIPAHNEGPTIGSVVLKARQFVGEVVVIDDGSTDDTAETAALAGATVVRHQLNKGYGAALKTCLDYAKRSETDVLVILDGDGQHRPELIPDVVKPVTSGEADISIGSRFLDARNALLIPRYRKFGIAVITGLTNLGTHHNAKVRDAQSGFRAYSRAAIVAISPRETDMGASAEILWEADKKGLRITEVPIEVRYDERSSSQGPIRHGLSVIATMIRYIETEHALLSFGLPGVVLFMLGSGLGYVVVDSYYRTQVLAVGWALVTVMLIVSGLVLVATGLILHAVINAVRRFK